MKPWHRLTPERKERLLTAIRECNRISICARLAGIEYSTLNRWRTKARQPGAPKALVELERDIQQALCEAEADLVKCWKSAAPQDWKAARDLLDRRYGGRWSPRSKVEHSGSIATKTTIVDATSNDESEYIAQLTTATAHQPNSNGKANGKADSGLP